MKEQTLAVDEFNQPKELDGNDAIYTLIIRLILLEKGTIKAHPDMGVGILSRYRYYDSDKLDDLRQDIYNQINQYLPLLLVTDVRVEFNESRKTIVIGIIIDNSVYYVINADYNNNTVQLADIASVT